MSDEPENLHSPLNPPNSEPTGGIDRIKDATGYKSQDSSLRKLIVTTIGMALLLAMGYMLMLTLLAERPQFVGWRLEPTPRSSEQLSPVICVRPVGSPSQQYVIRGVDTGEIIYAMQPNEDWRGLKVARSLSGEFQGKFEVNNPSETDWHLAFQCPFPAESTSTYRAPESKATIATHFDVRGAPGGETQTTQYGWFWTGVLPPGAKAIFQLNYELRAIRGTSYGLNGAIHEFPGMHTVALAVEAGNGKNPRPIPLTIAGGNKGGERVEAIKYAWSRPLLDKNESYGFALRPGFSVLNGLERLLQLAPLVTGLFLVALLALLTRGRAARKSEVAVLAVIYGYYFPLVAYLCAQYPFPYALLIAFSASATILINYLRFLVGNIRGFVGGLGLLLAFQVLPTVMAFSQLDRGLVLLSLGAISLVAVVKMQTDRLTTGAVKSSAVMAACLFVTIGSFSAPALGQPMITDKVVCDEEPPEVCAQKSPKLDLAEAPLTARVRAEVEERARLIFETEKRRLSLSLTTYEVTWQPAYLEMQASSTLEVIGKHPQTHKLLGPGAYFSKIEVPEFLLPLPDPTGLMMQMEANGKGSLLIQYRAPVVHDGLNRHCLLPLFVGSAGHLTLHSPRPDLVFEGGHVWSRTTEENSTAYEIGLAWSDALIIKWKAGRPLEDFGDLAGEDPLALEELVPPTRVDRIAIQQSQHLTMVNPDGRLLHFVRFSLAKNLSQETFDLRIPPTYEIVSLTVNGKNAPTPKSENGTYPIPLRSRNHPEQAQEVALRLQAHVPEIGFRGSWNLSLPRAAQTEGAIHWTIAGPRHFRLAYAGKNLEPALGKTPSDFGDYDSMLKSRLPIKLWSTLVTPGQLSASIDYVQEVPGITDGVR
jgi:hypothetical protein